MVLIRPEEPRDIEAGRALDLAAFKGGPEAAM